jgi:N-acetylmuramoyl-L-alanine amidase
MSMKTITHIVVHYSATYEDQNLTRADIDKMHKARGWTMVGYHYVIRRDGTVEIGRPETTVGAHVGGQNTGKIGICCIGGLNRATGSNVGVDNRTPEQIESLIKLIRDIRKRHPKAEVVGHRDLAATQCPGFDVRTWWAKVNSAPLPSPTPVKPTAPVVTPNIIEGDKYTVRKGDTWFSIARKYNLTVTSLLNMNNAVADDVLRIGRKLCVTPIATQKPKIVGEPKAPEAPRSWAMEIIAAIGAAIAAALVYYFS